MTQPGYSVAPNPELAEYLRKLEIPPKQVHFIALRDYMRETAEHGVPLDEGINHVAKMTGLLGMAQIQTIEVFSNIVRNLAPLGSQAKGQQ